MMARRINDAEYMDCIQQELQNANDDLSEKDKITLALGCIEQQLADEFTQRDDLINGFVKMVYDHSRGQVSYLLFSTQKYFPKSDEPYVDYIDFCRELLCANRLPIYFEIESIAKMVGSIKNNGSMDLAENIGNFVIIRKFFQLMIDNNMDGIKDLEAIYGNDFSNVLINCIE